MMLERVFSSLGEMHAKDGSFELDGFGQRPWMCLQVRVSMSCGFIWVADALLPLDQ